MSIIKIRQALNTWENKKLVELIADLAKKYKNVSDYLNYVLDPNENEQFEKYKEKVLEAFYPKRGYELKLKDGKTAIADFKKLQPSAILLADLMLYYVECGVTFTNEFGDIDEPFYDSISKMFSKSLQLMKQEDLLDKFQPRCIKVLENTENIGWGFNQDLQAAYGRYFVDEAESD